MKLNDNIQENNELSIDEKLNELLEDIKDSKTPNNPPSEELITDTIKFLNENNLNTKEDIINYFYDSKLEEESSIHKKGGVALLSLALFMGLSGGLQASNDYVSTHPVSQGIEQVVEQTTEQDFNTNYDNFIDGIKQGNIKIDGNNLTYILDTTDITPNPPFDMKPFNQEELHIETFDEAPLGEYSETGHAMEIINGAIEGMAEVDPKNDDELETLPPQIHIEAPYGGPDPNDNLTNLGIDYDNNQIDVPSEEQLNESLQEESINEVPLGNLDCETETEDHFDEASLEDLNVDSDVQTSDDSTDEI